MLNVFEQAYASVKLMDNIARSTAWTWTRRFHGLIARVNCQIFQRSHPFMMNILVASIHLAV